MARAAREIDEIEITPEMVEAGILSIPKWSDDYAEIVECVYVAMERVRRSAAVPHLASR